MFSLLYDDGKSRSSLEDAVEFLKVPKEYTKTLISLIRKTFA